MEALQAGTDSCVSQPINTIEHQLFTRKIAKKRKDTSFSIDVSWLVGTGMTKVKSLIVCAEPSPWREVATNLVASRA